MKSRILSQVFRLLVLVGILSLSLLMAAWLNNDFRSWAHTLIWHRLLGNDFHPKDALIQPVAVGKLNPAQARVVTELGNKYHIAAEVIAALYLEAIDLSNTSKLEPHLILAIMAVESNFHPYVRSEAGAQGLMQVMPNIHYKRYDKYGGPLAAYDPVSNMHVGVDILVDCIKFKSGSVEEGIIFYFGGANKDNGLAYLQKVKYEQSQMDTWASQEMTRQNQKERK
jgi:soluble lytic murein transglycosylase-like protein